MTKTNLKNTRRAWTAALILGIASASAPAAAAIATIAGELAA